MEPNRELNPNKLLRSPQGLTFPELAALNQGVILGPLVSDQPVDEVDPFVSQGLAIMSGHAVKGFIDEYTDSDEEYRRLLGRFKQIKSTVPPSMIGDFGYPVDQAIDEPKTQERTQRTAEEVYTEILFDGKTPRYDKIHIVLARNPKDPETLLFLEDLFIRQGVDLNHPANKDVSERVYDSTADSLDRQIFTDKGKLGDKELERLAVSWIDSLPDALTDTAINTRIGVIRKAIKLADPSCKNVDFTISLMRNVLESTTLLRQAADDKDKRASEIVDRIEGPLFKRIVQHNQDEAEQIIKALQSAGHKIKVELVPPKGGGPSVLSVYCGSTLRRAA